MATYNTLPVSADVEADKPLLSRDIKVNAKTLIGGAAIAAFVLGALAATAVSTTPSIRGADFHSSSSGDLVQIADARTNTKCMEVLAPYKNGKIGVKPCNGKQSQLFHYNEHKGQIRFTNYKGEEFCVDALGGGSFRAGDSIGLYKCKSGDKNSIWTTTSEQAIVLKSKFGGDTICMTQEGNSVKGGTECSSKYGLPSTAQWNIQKPSKPAPAPTPSPGGQSCGKVCFKDSDCLTSGGFGCTRCSPYDTGAHGTCY